MRLDQLRLDLVFDLAGQEIRRQAAVHLSPGLFAQRLQFCKEAVPP